MLGPIDRRCLIAAKVEATRGTPETVSLATDAVRLLAPPTVEPLWLAENEQDDLVTGGSGTAAPEVPAGAAMRMRGRTRVLGAGAAYAAAVRSEFDPLLRTLFGATVDATPGSESILYEIPSYWNTGATVVCQYMGHEYTLTASVLESLRLILTPGGMGVWDFSVIGILNAFGDQALESATYDDVAAAIWKGAGAYSIGGYAAAVQSAELDFGIEVQPLPDGNAADGHAGYQIVKVAPTLSSRVRIPTLATFNPKTLKDARTKSQLDIRVGATGAGGQYKRMTVDATAAVLRNYSPSAEGRIGVWDLEHLLAEPAAGNAYVDLLFD